MLALTNLCVDIVQSVEVLPSDEPAAARRAAYDALHASAPPPAQWEVGGATNFAIAAARLGLRSSCLGHTGRDVYGAFLEGVLRDEHVGLHQLLADGEPGPPTLLCWVLIDAHTGAHGARERSHESHVIPSRRTLMPRHLPPAFTSRFDFDPSPLLGCGASLPPHWVEPLRSTAWLAVNGFAFDDLAPPTVLAAVAACRAAGGRVLFDAGPRARLLAADVPAGGAAALRHLMSTADVLLLTEEEAEALTGTSEAGDAAAALLASSRAEDPWVVVKRGANGCTALTRSAAAAAAAEAEAEAEAAAEAGGREGGGGSGRSLRGSRGGVVSLPAMVVASVADTVGCGDSFAAAVALGRARGGDLRHTLALANAVGAATATGRGAGRNVARVGAVRRLLEEAAMAGGGSDAEREAAQGARKLIDF